MCSRLDEAGLEELIVEQMITGDVPAPLWHEGLATNFVAAHGLDLTELAAFVVATQPNLAGTLGLTVDSPTRTKFLARLRDEISKHGIVVVLRNGIDYNQHHVDLYYPTPTPGNTKASEQFAANRFTITRQIHYSATDVGKAIDLVAFVNGLPVATFELKNLITKQTVEDAVHQYRRDRNPREPLFQFGRCMAHFAVDDAGVRFCTHAKGSGSQFLPFDQGWKDGAGNPPNPGGVRTDYLWKRVLAPASLANIIENYAQVVTTKNPTTGKKSSSQVFPRYHQLDVVRRLLDDVAARGVGQRYLIQHSAGSGKSNSIAWLAHQLPVVKRDGTAVFDSVVVVTDRVVLDHQIRDTIKSFVQVGSTLQHADSSKDLREAIEAGKKIIITTVQKFPFILEGIGSEHRNRSFAIIIDEAHSSQGGKTMGALASALSTAGAPREDEDIEDQINRIIEAKKLLKNASYFAFTATPKNKTLETFGDPFSEGGVVKHRPFHSYTMKQAIQEGFILDVLANYVPVDSYYRLVKTVEDDPEFDSKRASSKLRHYVEGHRHAIREKADIMVEHFLNQVIAKRKIGGEARAMVVTDSIDRAIAYFEAVSASLAEHKSPYKAIVAFSDVERDGVRVTESQHNRFPSSEITTRIKEDPYRFLVCADKFQTGYDEPLLHTMYVDKVLSGVKAVQTLSRLNRSCPGKDDVTVLDFENDSESISEAFEPYYRTTVLADETDPNKLHDLASILEQTGVFAREHVEAFVERYLEGAPIDELHPMLDACVAEYVEQMDEDEQVEFKGSAKAFVRTYAFLSGILPYGSPWWEKLSIFLGFLVPKLPAPRGDDLSKGILETIDMDSYRAEKRAAMAIALADADAEIDPVPLGAGGVRPDPELALLSEIVRAFNDLWGNTDWDDKDRVLKRITEEIPQRVAADEAYQLAQANNDEANARVEMEAALGRVMVLMMRDETQLFKQFQDNVDFKRWLEGSVFHQTYKKSA